MVYMKPKNNEKYIKCKGSHNSSKNMKDQVFILLESEFNLSELGSDNKMSRLAETWYSSLF